MHRRLFTAASLILCSGYVALALAMTQGSYPLSPDSAHNALLARNLVSGQGYRVQIIQYHVGDFDGVWHMPEMHGVLQPFVLAGLFGSFGSDDAWVRVPGFLWVGAAGFLVSLLGRRLFGPVAGLLACVLTLGSPTLFTWAWIGTDDPGFAALFAAVLVAYEGALRRRRARDFVWTGVVAAAALAQKATGILIPAVLLPPLLLLRDVPARVRLAFAAAITLPWAAVLSLYLARNWISHGGITFRWGPIDWLYKSQGLGAYFAIYEDIPSLAGVLSSLGAEEVVRIVVAQLGIFLDHAVWATPAPFDGALVWPGLVFPIGLLLLVPHLASSWRLAVPALLATLGTVTLVCAIWHIELRFFTHLIPIVCLSFAGIDRWVVPWARGHALRSGLRLGGIALLGVGVVAQLGSREIPLRDRGAPRCSDAYAWIQSHTEAGSPFLALDPWTLAWRTGRPAVSVPSGGTEEITRIAERYDVEWVLVEPYPVRAREAAELRDLAASPRSNDPVPSSEAASSSAPAEGGQLRAELAFEGATCDVLELRRASRSR